MTARTWAAVSAACLALSTSPIVMPAGIASASAPDRGAVQVLYAGSLVRVMEQSIGPQFDRSTGYRFVGFGAGSDELANEIKGGIRQGDAFVSASPNVNKSLQGSANGNWAKWYVAFARAPLVLGYNPQSRFAALLRKRPWYDVVTAPGFQLGRTDPVLDPKGALSVSAVHDTASRVHDRALLNVLNGTGGVFPEETLVGRLQTGQLDAGFFYTVEAKAAGIPTVRLAPVSLAATYTVTVLNRASDRAGGLAFVRFLLGPSARRTLANAGFVLARPPRVSGQRPPSAITSFAAKR